MGKATAIVNYRVEVRPAGKPWGNKTTLDLCEEIAASIRRHVDDVGGVSVLYDRKHTCSFCGAKWTEDGPVFNGGCCDKDMENEPT